MPTHVGDHNAFLYTHMKLKRLLCDGKVYYNSPHAQKEKKKE